VGPFQAGQLLEEPVVFGVRDLRPVEDVIEAVVVADRAAQ